MANFKNKLELYQILQETITRNLVITGSTALQLYGLNAYSSPTDLDLIIYEKDHTDGIKRAISTLHSVTGTNKPYMEVKDEREVGMLFSMLFKSFFKDDFGNDATMEIQVHLFLMKEEKRPQVSMRINNHWYYLASPMNIIEAKKYMGRKKDYADLAKMCGRIITPMPDKIVVDGTASINKQTNK